jgi:hypothetical protein
MQILKSSDYGTDLDGIFTLDEFVAEFSDRYERGQHVVAFGPTGRGKTTVMGKLLKSTHPSAGQHTVTTTINPDKALAEIGSPIKSWPPSVLQRSRTFRWGGLTRDDPKTILQWRYEPMVTKRAQLATVRKTNETLLTWLFGKRNWRIFIADLQIYSDRRLMNLGAEIEQLILTIRKLESSVWLDAQAPRWIPSAVKDQPTHLLIWRNRNEDVMKDLARATGINRSSTMSIFSSNASTPEEKRKHYRDFIWVDGLADEWFLVENPPI